MASTSESVAMNANQASQAAALAAESSQQGRTKVAETSDSLEQLNREIEGAAGAVDSLAKGSLQIIAVLDVIRDIAGQTNLLALNAAIEAARAGEQGRGFAVVADEVRALAHRTGQSTEEIQRMVGEIQSYSEQAIEVMNRSAMFSRESLVRVGEARACIEQIEANIGEINDMNAMIATATEQQTATAQEIDSNLSSISCISSQTSAASGQTSIASGEVARLAVELNNQMSYFKVS
ncbi:methyl-accepting chemotaxis protein [Pseudomonas schmalbachii]